MADQESGVDTLLAEVSALADEAVTELGDAPEEAAPQERPAPSPEDAGSTGRGKPAAPRSGNVQRVLHLEVPVIVRLAERSMPLSGILNLTSGAIIEFDKSADGELDLLINNKCIGHGQAVKVGENFGLRITKIGSLEDRIKAMGA